MGGKIKSKPTKVTNIYLIVIIYLHCFLITVTNPIVLVSLANHFQTNCRPEQQLVLFPSLMFISVPELELANFHEQAYTGKAISMNLCGKTKFVLKRMKWFIVISINSRVQVKRSFLQQISITISFSRCLIFD